MKWHFLDKYLRVQCQEWALVLAATMLPTYSWWLEHRKLHLSRKSIEREFRHTKLQWGWSQTANRDCKCPCRLDNCSQDDHNYLDRHWLELYSRRCRMPSTSGAKRACRMWKDPNQYKRRLLQFAELEEAQALGLGHPRPMYSQVRCCSHSG